MRHGLKLMITMRLPRPPLVLVLTGQLKHPTTRLLSQNRLIHLHRPMFLAITCLNSSQKKNFLDVDRKSGLLKNVLQQKKEILRDTEQRLRLRGEEIIKDIRHHKDITEQRIKDKKEHIIKDILATKAKVKEKFEEVVELDGWIARTWISQSSKMGSFLDPMADKVLVGTMFVSLTWQQLIPLPLTLLIIVRDVALVVAGFVIRYRSLPPPRTLSRYLDVTHATAQLAPTTISKVNTAVQLLLVGSTLAAPVFGYVNHAALQTLWGVTAASTFVSAASYVISKNTYKILKKSRPPR